MRGVNDANLVRKGAEIGRIEYYSRTKVRVRLSEIKRLSRVFFADVEDGERSIPEGIYEAFSRREKAV